MYVKMCLNRQVLLSRFNKCSNYFIQREMNKWSSASCLEFMVIFYIHPREWKLWKAKNCDKTCMWFIWYDTRCEQALRLVIFRDLLMHLACLCCWQITHVNSFTRYPFVLLSQMINNINWTKLKTKK